MCQSESDLKTGLLFDEKSSTSSSPSGKKKKKKKKKFTKNVVLPLVYPSASDSDGDSSKKNSSHLVCAIAYKQASSVNADHKPLLQYLGKKKLFKKQIAIKSTNELDALLIACGGLANAKLAFGLMDSAGMKYDSLANLTRGVTHARNEPAVYELVNREKKKLLQYLQTKAGKSLLSGKIAVKMNDIIMLVYAGKPQWPSPPPPSSSPNSDGANTAVDNVRVVHGYATPYDVSKPSLTVRRLQTLVLEQKKFTNFADIISTVSGMA